MSDPRGLPDSTHVTRAVKVEVDIMIRCSGRVVVHDDERECGKLLAEQAGRPWRIKCSRCGTVNRSSDAGRAPGM